MRRQRRKFLEPLNVRVANILSYRDGSLPCDTSRNNFSLSGPTGRDNGRRKLKFRPIHAKTGELRTELCDLRPATCVSVRTASANFIGNLSRTIEFIATALQPPLRLLLSILPLASFFLLFARICISQLTPVQPPFGAISPGNIFQIPRCVTSTAMIASYEQRTRGRTRFSAIKEKICEPRDA